MHSSPRLGVQGVAAVEAVLMVAFKKNPLGSRSL